MHSCCFSCTTGAIRHRLRELSPTQNREVLWLPHQARPSVLVSGQEEGQEGGQGGQKCGSRTWLLVTGRYQVGLPAASHPREGRVAMTGCGKIFQASSSQMLLPVNQHLKVKRSVAAVWYWSFQQPLQWMPSAHTLVHLRVVVVRNSSGALISYTIPNLETISWVSQSMDMEHHSVILPREVFSSSIFACHAWVNSFV